MRVPAIRASSVGYPRDAGSKYSVMRAVGSCYCLTRPRNAAARLTTVRARSTTGTSIIAPSN
jgi:hypothetical protein